MSANKFNSYTSLKSEFQETDNPENAFTKLLSIPEDPLAIRECKMLLDTMKEQALFQKNVVRKNYEQQIPTYARLNQQKQENFNNYQRLLSYSKRKKDTNDYERKTCGKSGTPIKKNHVRNLRSFIEEKKVRMLTEESKQKSNDVYVQYILKDDKLRQKLFDEAILLQRLNFIKREQMTDQKEISSIPKKIRGLNPKHLRIPEGSLDEKSFYRRKYVHNQRSFQYFKNALKTQNNLLKNKQKDNTLVISNLMNHFSEQVLESKREDICSQISQCVRRLFLTYANNDSEDVKRMYKFISKENMKQFLQEFDLQYSKQSKIGQIIENYEISQFYFLEIIHLLSLSKDDEFIANTHTFFQQKIMKYPQKYLPKEWQLYDAHSNFINKHLKIRRFYQKLNLIYEIAKKQRRSQSHYYNFDEMVQVMWMLKIYPFMISKKKLRFFYLYKQNQQAGIKFQDIADIYIYIALSKEGVVQENVRQIVAMVVQYTKNKKNENLL